ncbi:MAG TPA: polyprenyl synthetase family protein [Candidatus Aminicenantes bacterium]|nr:polyprenyl synthetase family protein [Candidatus Aminicenantes bacterium]HDT13662.1 polyprenyl synthetase family protein [Candidatus Aminicenantes bacterium]
MTFETYFRGTRAKLLADLRDLLGRKRERLAARRPWGSDVLRRLGEFSRRGKLIRGGLVCLGYEMTGRRLSGAAVRAGTALELMQSALLIHDDIMDLDAFRRGAPALHRQYAEMGGREAVGDADHFGVSMGICAGEIAIFLAFEALAGLPGPCRRTVEAQKLFAAEFGLVGLGQMRDIQTGASPRLIEAREALDLYRFKTARYSFALPLAMGWILGGGAPSVRPKLERLGEHLGLIFQIKDDELGLFGDEAVLGKPVGSDIRQGKKTLLYLRLVEKAGEKERRTLAGLFGRPDLTAGDVEVVRRLARRHAVVDDIRAIMRRYGRRAGTAIRTLPVAAPFREVLETLLEFSLERRS